MTKTRAVRGGGLLLLLATGVLAGCYENVVDARGVGADGRTIHERQISNTWIDRQLFGDAYPKSSRKGAAE